MNRRIAVVVLALTAAFVASAPVGMSARPAPQRERNLIWHNPGNVAALNLAWGEGGQATAPKPPFTFIKEDTGGTNPKIEVRDARGVVWGVKWGEEIHSEVFASRIVWAMGYYVEPAYFVASGKIGGVTGLDRAKKYVNADGTFQDARFEKKDKSITKLSDEESWRYDRNPFVGTKELNGLKILIMLVSNWDSKDQEHASKGSNTKIFVVKTRAITENRYVVSDWGGTMGKWGNFLRRDKWNCESYQDQNDDFVKGVKNGEVDWGYSGQHTGSIKDGIPVAHVGWLMGYLGKLSDGQIRDALRASGASASEQACFTGAVRARISRLQALVR